MHSQGKNITRKLRHSEGDNGGVMSYHSHAAGGEERRGEESHKTCKHRQVFCIVAGALSSYHTSEVSSEVNWSGCGRTDGCTDNVNTRLLYREHATLVRHK